MLSERESQALRRIEQAMRTEAPDLAGALERMESDPGWSRRRHDAAALAALLTALTCLAVGAIAAAAVALLLGAAVLRIRRWRFPMSGVSVGLFRNS